MAPIWHLFLFSYYPRALIPDLARSPCRAPRTLSGPDASRRNGALSRGPVTPGGKAAGAGNGTRHGLLAAEFCPVAHEEVRLAALLDDLARCHRAAGEVEAYWVQQVAIGMLRRERLDALQLRVLDAALEGAAAPREAGLPSPATVLRYRARLQRDHEQAARKLGPARALRGRHPAEQTNPSRAMAGQRAQLEAGAAADAERAMARHLAMRGAGGKNEPEATAPLALNRAQRRRMEARQHQVAQG
ncbi:hypothetical protein [Marinimicrococcus flavescens]|uniref:Uncharacterized protein n=1 Tax=Marinimicrococcus flavescens TaxID=3031815 RepID=A0AAP3V0C0_9PROT|nr:hypothetical protein [Marinimicrococcus flavescens]